MRAAFATFLTILLWIASLQGVVSVPLRAIVGDGSPDNIKRIKDATEAANKQIKNMQGVLNGPNPASHPAVVKAFGNNANIDEIKKNVNTLDTGKLKVPNPDPAAGITQGATNTVSKAVSFGSAFHNSDEKTRAGTVIHEAAHANHGAVDHFDPNGNPHHQGTQFDKGKAQVGYKDSHLDQLKAQASHNMHHNADSYRVFGEECPQARELFRRALEESDPVAREYLVRRAGASCAWRPKSPKAAHAKADVHSHPANVHSHPANVHSHPANVHSHQTNVHSHPANVHSHQAKAESHSVKKAPKAARVNRARPVAKVAGSRRPVSARRPKRN